jgi:hypothetical protein
MAERDGRAKPKNKIRPSSNYPASSSSTSKSYVTSKYPKPLTPRPSNRTIQPGNLVSYSPGAADAGDVIVAPDWSWHTWIGSLWARLTADPAIAFALTVFLTHRLLLFALGAFFAPFVPQVPPLGASLLRDVDPRHWGPAFFLLAPWQRWDTNWYIHIAHFGYAIGDGTTNYPPLYPLAVGVLGRLLLEQYMLAAMLISNLAYIFALVYFYRLCTRLFNVEITRRAILFLATFPTAFFLASGYTESLYLALVLAAFYYAEEGHWWPVTILTVLACLTRLQGIILVVPLAYIDLQKRQFNWRKITREGLALVALPPVGLGLYLGYVYFILGDFNFNNHLAVVWHVKFAWPWETFFGGLVGFFDPNNAHNLIYNVMDLILLVVFVCLIIIWAQRKLPMAYLIYSVLTMGVFLTRQGVDGFFWMSLNRYVLAVFPVFMLAGQIAPRYLIKVSAVVQAVWAILFVFWMWAG